MTRRTSRKLRSNRRRPAITSKASKPKKLKMKWPAAIDYDTRIALGLPVHGKKSRRTSRKPVRKNSRRRTSLRRNGDVKITNKQLNSYYAMKQGGPSANDGYNIQEYGMTYEQFRAIGRLEEEMGGADSASQFNRFLAGAKINLTRASQSEIDALAKAFERKIRKNSRRRTSRGLRRNSEQGLPHGQRLAKRLKSHWAHVSYDPATGTGWAKAGILGTVTFEESGNDPAVWVTVPAMRFKTDAANAMATLNKLHKVLNSAG
jgi:hypothetical protein